MINQQIWLARAAAHMPHIPQDNTDVSVKEIAGLRTSTQIVAMILGDFRSPMPRIAATLMIRMICINN